MDFTRQALSACAALTMLTALGAVTASAQSADSLDSLNTHLLQEVEVNGNVIRKDVSSTAPAYRISAADMQKMGVTDISDALHRLPGINLRDYGGAGGMKTASVRGFGAEHTGVIYDGVALSDCQNGRIDLSRYSLDNIGSISMIVGDDNDIFIPAKAAASAAKIMLNTLSVPTADDESWLLTAQLKTGSFGLISPYLRVGKTVTPAFSWSAIGEFTHADNDYPFTLKDGGLTVKERRSNSRLNSGHGELNAVWRPSSRRSLAAKAYYYDNDRRLPGAVVLYNPVSNESLRDRNFFGQLKWKDTSHDKVWWQALAKFNWDATFYHDQDGKYPGGFLQENYWQKEVYVSGSVLYKPTADWSFDYSADYSYNNLTTNLINDQHPTRNSILQTATAQYKTERLVAMARVLWSVYENDVRTGESAKDASRLSPTVSLSFRPFVDRLFFIRASYKNIFRMPTFNDSYYYHLGSVSLKPESTDQFNIGMTWQAPRLAHLKEAAVTVDGYYNKVKDKIVGIPQNMFIWTMMNVDMVRAYGIDVTANTTYEIKKGQSLIFAGNYSWQRVQPRTNPKNPDYNKQVAYTPQHSGAASLSYENPWVNFVFHGSGASDRFGTNSNNPQSRIAGYIDCGAALYKNIPLNRHSFDIRFDVMNIFNHQYEIVARYPMPGRSWRLTLAYNL